MAPIPNLQIPHPSRPLFRRLLGAMSVFTMLMTVPQVWSVWVAHEAAGVSVASWSAYLLSALLWFWHGVQQGDRNIYLPCIGWIGLDSAVIIGTMLYQ